MACIRKILGAVLTSLRTVSLVSTIYFPYYEYFIYPPSHSDRSLAVVMTFTAYSLSIVLIWRGMDIMRGRQGRK